MAQLQTELKIELDIWLSLGYFPPFNFVEIAIMEKIILLYAVCIKF